MKSNDNTAGTETAVQEEEVNDGLTIADLLKIVRNHWILAVATLLVVFVATAGYTFTRTPQYTAKAELLATYRGTASSTSSTVSGGDLNSGANYLNSQIQTYPQLVKTESVLQPVIDELGLRTTVSGLAGKVTASNPSDTMLVDISVNDPNPKSASQIANGVAESLKKQVTSTIYSDDGDKIISPVNLDIVQQAYAPSSPSSPNIKLNLAVGVVAGAVLGVVVALMRDLLDRRVRSDTDVTSVCTAPVLGSLPRTETFEANAPVVISHPSSQEAEEVRRLRTNLVFSTGDEPRNNVIVVTSPGPREGKTTVAANLAAAFAEAGNKVLLVDADVRHPSVGEKLGIEGTIGLTHMLTNKVSSKEAIQRYWKPNFHILPAGKQSMNPSVLLNSRAMRSMIEQVSGVYDYVIIDTAPLQVANEAAVFAKEGPELLMVVGYGATEKKHLRDSLQELRTLDIEPVGVAVNLTEPEKPHKSGYYYYEDENGDKKKGTHSSK